MGHQVLLEREDRLVQQDRKENPVAEARLELKVTVAQQVKRVSRVKPDYRVFRDARVILVPKVTQE